MNDKIKLKEALQERPREEILALASRLHTQAILRIVSGKDDTPEHRDLLKRIGECVQRAM